jgi:hypothetical protein
MMRGDGDEMGPAFPVHLVGPADQPQIELVQGRRFERVSGPLAP